MFLWELKLNSSFCLTGTKSPHKDTWTPCPSLIKESFPFYAAQIFYKKDTSLTCFDVKCLHDVKKTFFCFRAVGNQISELHQTNICAWVASLKLSFKWCLNLRLRCRGRSTCWMLLPEFNLRSFCSSPPSELKSTDYNLQRDAHRDTPSKALCNLLW